MPTSAPKPCTQCGVLVRDGSSRCEAHKSKASNFGRQLSRHQRGYGTAWDKLRLVVLSRDSGLCQVCTPTGRVTLGGIVDHIRPKAEGGDDDLSNLQTICKPCHDRKTAFESARGGGQVALMPEWLPAPAVPVVVVCGPPGSGKTTWVSEQAGPQDLVIDVDVLASELTGKPMYQATREETVGALRVRNKLLASLADVKTCRKAYLIVTAGEPAQRDWWMRKLKAEIKVMPTPKAECEARIRADTRRPGVVKVQHIRAVMEWA